MSSQSSRDIFTYTAKTALDNLSEIWDESFAKAERDYEVFGKAVIEIGEVEISEQIGREIWCMLGGGGRPTVEKQIKQEQELQSEEDGNAHGDAIAYPSNLHVEAIASTTKFSATKQHSVTKPSLEPTAAHTNTSAKSTLFLAKNTKSSLITAEGTSSASSYSANLPISKDNAPPSGVVLTKENCFPHCADVATPFSDHGGAKWSNYLLNMRSVIELQYCKLQLKRVTYSQQNKIGKLHTKWCIIWPVYRAKVETPAMLQELQHVGQFWRWLQGQQYLPKHENICNRYRQFSKECQREGEVGASWKRVRGDEGDGEEVGSGKR
ncbi:hypothetical protein BPAE_0078g00220 [Botrytis paeoniae]|uniref:Uncharacterized protein n=1 Tax=Botrytis paeoniae TaxID=278948 RepID=A0A4Z1FTD2_9HELO|nr:hypothetical protein BPAE_0078g00220 [Botrytis paeoniae]